MKTKIFLISGFVVLLSFSGELFAADEPTQTTAQQKHAGQCKGDIEKFCKDIQKGEGRIAQCLESHKSEVTTDCQHHMLSKKHHHEVKEACASDIKTYCPKPADGEKKPRLMQCLKENEAKLSPTCLTKFKEPKPAKE